MTPLLEIRNLSKIYEHSSIIPGLGGRSRGGSLRALSGIDLLLNPGDAMGIVGESGAGKTTLASLIIGLEKPSAGEILIDGSRIGQISERKPRAKKVQLVWQDAMASLDPRRTISDAIAEPLNIHGLASGIDAQAQVRKLMEEVGLSESLADRLPYEVSGGQAQRVVIARALALSPRIIICDEPASALDVQIKAQIADLLMRLRAERELTYLIIAHDLPLVSKMTGILVVMYRGRIVEQGPTESIIRNPAHPYTRMLVAAQPTVGTDFLAFSDLFSRSRGNLPQAGGRGCPFSDRCPQMIEDCLSFEVSLSAAGDRLVACLLREG